MSDAWRVFRKTLSDVWNRLYLLAMVNILWVALNLLLVSGPPATAGLFVLTYRLARDQDAGLHDFFEGFRRYFWRSWLWAIVAGAGFFILGGDVVLVGSLSSADYVVFIQGFFLALLFLWAFLLLYAFPLLLEQKRPSLRLALRNAFVMFAGNRSFSVTLFGLALLVALLSSLLFAPWGVITVVFLALLGNHAVLNRLAAWRTRGAHPDEENSATTTSPG
ncbi:MAG: YesL family protein [Anaerolineae bacterium]|nr:YesL family protein [Anaerolineae bacterium]